MNVARRTRKLKALLDIRIGPGAARLSNDVKRIHLDFAHDFNDGHFGARKVWRTYLPRLQFHNPAVSMTVKRHSDQSGPSMLTIFYARFPASSSSNTLPAPTSSTNPSAKASGHNTWDRTETIDMKHKHESEVLSKLIELTDAVPYEPTKDELAELEEVTEEVRRSGRDRERQARFNEVKRQEAALLEQARGST